MVWYVCMVYITVHKVTPPDVEQCTIYRFPLIFVGDQLPTSGCSITIIIILRFGNYHFTSCTNFKS